MPHHPKSLTRYAPACGGKLCMLPQGVQSQMSLLLAPQLLLRLRLPELCQQLFDLITAATDARECRQNLDRRSCMIDTTLLS